jgi:hypothetical protein
MNEMFTGGGLRLHGGSLREYTSRHGLDSPTARVDHFADLLLATPLDEPIRMSLVRRLDVRAADMERGLGELLLAIGTLPEYQLG